MLTEVDEVLRQDMADVERLGIRGTPTFFVNTRLLADLGPQQLYTLVSEEVESTEADR